MWKESKSDLETKENHDNNIEKQRTLEKPKEKVQTDAKEFYVKEFYQELFLKYQLQKKELSESEKEKLFLEDVKDMDENTAMYPVESNCVDEPMYTKEELKEIEEDDAGYVNDKVIDYNNNTYCETGLQTNAVNWGNYAEGEKKYDMLSSGKLLSRWGGEEGSFMSDINVDYKELELPIIKEKNIQGLYEVIIPFPVEVSKVAKQPWNRKEGEEQGSDEKSEPVFQYRTPASVKKLIEEGFLQKL